MSKEILFKITAKDCNWDYYRGSGKGGQKKNKTSSAVRCKHRSSKAIGQAQDTRSKKQNKRLAFRRMFESKEFQKWLKIEIAIVTDERDFRVEVRKDGRWVPEGT
jgi:protein subunit release factor B